MPLTTIATPRKCLDLESGVCSGAPLLGAGFVGVLAAGPARLALVPIAGGDGKVADLSLAKVQELALLSRDVAVVRDGDHALWTITDPFGSMRVKQIARDVRALSMRPWGESAVALHTDGSATALTLNRQEVGARHLTVRGALRACDVGESVTFVVLDGEGGGQLRIHPGATPELGTSARTALPREAAELDRLRGGTGVSALFKRGSQALCVITGTPSKLAAKLVQLDAKPADVAVIEDCLLVAFVDGRVALYDAGTLDRAGDAPMTATSVATLAARGKPRVLLATAKGSAALWIGTTAGEVLCAALGREAAVAEPERSVAPRAVEERLSEPAPAPVPAAALAAELAATRDALTDTATAREAAEERARALATAAEETERALATAAEERAQLVASHGVALEELKAASVVALAATAEARAREGVEQEAAWAAKRAELEAALHGATAERDAARAELQEGAAGEAAWSAKRAELEAALHGATAERDAARAELEATQAARATADAAERARAAAAAEELARIAGEHAATIEAVRSEGARALDEQSAVHRRALDERTAAHAHAVDAQNAAHARAVDAQNAAHAQALDALRAAGAAALEEAARLARETLDARERELGEARTDLEAIRVRLADAEVARAALGSELDTATTERDVARLDLESARAGAAAAEERARSLEADLAARTAERDTLRADALRTARELAAERAKLEKDSLKWGDRRISLEGAHETVDSVLTQVKSVFLKRPRD